MILQWKKYDRQQRGTAARRRKPPDRGCGWMKRFSRRNITRPLARLGYCMTRHNSEAARAAR
ncbi:MAG TPA: hypothetical protein ENN97_03360 [Phycisphaerales bacterium]|nr:hypothetical protein [Phycisphaerales bacterium]